MLEPILGTVSVTGSLPFLNVQFKLPCWMNRKSHIKLYIVNVPRLHSGTILLSETTNTNASSLVKERKPP